MGNKISLGRIVIYCGFPAKRERTKRKERARQERMAAFEDFEACVLAEQLKALKVNEDPPLALGWYNTYDNDEYLPAPRSLFTEMEKRDDGELFYSGLPAFDRTCSYNSVISIDVDEPKPAAPNWSGDQSSHDFISAWSDDNDAVLPMKDHDAIVTEEVVHLIPEHLSDSPEPDAVAISEETTGVVSFVDNEGVEESSGALESVSSFKPGLQSTFLDPAQEIPTRPSSPEPPIVPVLVSESDTITDSTQSSRTSIAEEDAEVSRPSSPILASAPAEQCDATSTSSQSSSAPLAEPPVIPPRPPALSGVPANDPVPPPTSTCPPLHPRPPIVATSGRGRVIPSTSLCRSRSVTFADELVSSSSSSIQAPVKRDVSFGPSQDSSSNGVVPPPEKHTAVCDSGKQRNEELISKQSKCSGNISRRTNLSKASTKPKSGAAQQSRPRLQSMRLNGRCVYNSGFPSLIGDRIESASEDEELWETIIIPEPLPRQHVFCTNVVNHNLIPGSQLTKDFNPDEVSLYLKERYDQCNRYHYGMSAMCCNLHYQRRHHNNLSSIIPSVAQSSSSFESNAVLNILKDLHEELKKFHEETTYALRTQYGPRWSHVMERRQRNLESRMDSLEARNAVVSFEGTGAEGVQQQLKTLRHDLEILHQSRVNKQRATLINLDEIDKDIQVEDIEVVTSLDITHDKEPSNIDHDLPTVPAFQPVFDVPSVPAVRPISDIPDDVAPAVQHTPDVPAPAVQPIPDVHDVASAIQSIPDAPVVSSAFQPIPDVSVVAPTIQPIPDTPAIASAIESSQAALTVQSLQSLRAPLPSIQSSVDVSTNILSNQAVADVPAAVSELQDDPTLSALAAKLMADKKIEEETSLVERRRQRNENRTNVILKWREGLGGYNVMDAIWSPESSVAGLQPGQMSPILPSISDQDIRFSQMPVITSSDQLGGQLPSKVPSASCQPGHLPAVSPLGPVQDALRGQMPVLPSISDHTVQPVPPIFGQNIVSGQLSPTVPRSSEQTFPSSVENHANLPSIGDKNVDRITLDQTVELTHSVREKYSAQELMRVSIEPPTTQQTPSDYLALNKDPVFRASIPSLKPSAEVQHDSTDREDILLEHATPPAIPRVSVEPGEESIVEKSEESVAEKIEQNLPPSSVDNVGTEDKLSEPVIPSTKTSVAVESEPGTKSIVANIGTVGENLSSPKKSDQTLSSTKKSDQTLSFPKGSDRTLFSLKDSDQTPSSRKETDHDVQSDSADDLDRKKDKPLRGILTSRERLQSGVSPLGPSNPLSAVRLGKSVSFNEYTYVKEFTCSDYEDDDEESESENLEEESSVEYDLESAEDAARKYSGNYEDDYEDSDSGENSANVADVQQSIKAENKAVVSEEELDDAEENVAESCSEEVKSSKDTAFVESRGQEEQQHGHGQVRETCDKEGQGRGQEQPGPEEQGGGLFGNTKAEDEAGVSEEEGEDEEESVAKSNSDERESSRGRDVESRGEEQAVCGQEERPSGTEEQLHSPKQPATNPEEQRRGYPKKIDAEDPLVVPEEELEDEEESVAESCSEELGFCKDASVEVSRNPEEQEHDQDEGTRGEIEQGPGIPQPIDVEHEVDVPEEELEEESVVESCSGELETRGQEPQFGCGQEEQARGHEGQERYSKEHARDSVEQARDTKDQACDSVERPCDRRQPGAGSENQGHEVSQTVHTEDDVDIPEEELEDEEGSNAEKCSVVESRGQEQQAVEDAEVDVPQEELEDEETSVAESRSEEPEDSKDTPLVESQRQELSGLGQGSQARGSEEQGPGITRSMDVEDDADVPEEELEDEEESVAESCSEEFEFSEGQARGREEKPRDQKELATHGADEQRPGTGEQGRGIVSSVGAEDVLDIPEEELEPVEESIAVSCSEEPSVGQEEQSVYDPEQQQHGLEEQRTDQREQLCGIPTNVDAEDVLDVPEEELEPQEESVVWGCEPSTVESSGQGGQPLHDSEEQGCGREVQETGEQGCPILTKIDAEDALDVAEEELEDEEESVAESCSEELGSSRGHDVESRGQGQRSQRDQDEPTRDPEEQARGLEQVGPKSAEEQERGSPLKMEAEDDVPEGEEVDESVAKSCSEELESSKHEEEGTADREQGPRDMKGKGEVNVPEGIEKEKESVDESSSEGQESSGGGTLAKSRGQDVEPREQVQQCERGTEQMCDSEEQGIDLKKQPGDTVEEGRSSDRQEPGPKHRGPTAGRARSCVEYDDYDGDSWITPGEESIDSVREPTSTMSSATKINPFYNDFIRSETSSMWNTTVEDSPVKPSGNVVNDGWVIPGEKHNESVQQARSRDGETKNSEKVNAVEKDTQPGQRVPRNEPMLEKRLDEEISRVGQDIPRDDDKWIAWYSRADEGSRTGKDSLRADEERLRGDNTISRVDNKWIPWNSKETSRDNETKSPVKMISRSDEKTSRAGNDPLRGDKEISRALTGTFRRAEGEKSTLMKEFVGSYNQGVPGPSEGGKEPTSDEMEYSDYLSSDSSDTNKDSIPEKTPIKEQYGTNIGNFNDGGFEYGRQFGTVTDVQKTKNDGTAKPGTRQVSRPTFGTPTSSDKLNEKDVENIPDHQSEDIKESSGMVGKQDTSVDNVGDTLSDVTSISEAGRGFSTLAGLTAQRTLVAGGGKADVVPAHGKPDVVPAHGKPDVVPAHGKPDVVPAHGKPDVVPAHGKPDVVPAHGKPDVVSAHGKPDVVPAHGKPDVVPAHGKPDVVPAHGKPDVVPAHGKPDVVSAHGKPDVVPAHGKPDVVPAHGKPDVVPAHGKPDVVPAHGKPDVVPAHGKPDVVPAHGKPDVVPAHGKPDVVSAHGKPDVVPAHGKPDVVPAHGKSDVVSAYGKPDVEEKNRESRERTQDSNFEKKETTQSGTKTVTSKDPAATVSSFDPTKIHPVGAAVVKSLPTTTPLNTKKPEIGEEKKKEKKTINDEESSSSESLSEIGRQLFPGEDLKIVKRPKKLRSDDDSPVMKELAEIRSRMRPNSAIKNMAAEKAAKKERERLEQEARDQAYQSKSLGLRTLEKFRDDIIAKPSTFVEHEVSADEYMQHMVDFESIAPGMIGDSGVGLLHRGRMGEHSAYEEPRPRTVPHPFGNQGAFPHLGMGGRNAPRLPTIGLPTLEATSEGGRLERKPSAIGRPTHHGYNEYRGPLGIDFAGQPTELSRAHPAFEDNAQVGLNSYENMFGRPVLEQPSHHAMGRRASSVPAIAERSPSYDERARAIAERASSFDQPGGSSYSMTTHEYRVPQERKPAALIPLRSAKKPANDMASKVASLQAAMGFVEDDPWTPPPLPRIEKCSKPIRGTHFEQPSLNDIPKPAAVPSLGPRKPSVLPGIGHNPLPGIGRRSLPDIGSLQKDTPSFGSSPSLDKVGSRYNPVKSFENAPKRPSDPSSPSESRDKLLLSNAFGNQDYLSSEESSHEGYNELAMLEDLVRDIPTPDEMRAENFFRDDDNMSDDFR